ncbi:hypothetical protein XENOCAPTIV_030025 [Xenoophorus captivus]|uniref:Uncharacterized protein n=1 Tax=Xenoophorus captivus TaxID=1517983 RepID=A0ABV0QKZ4_9TELE
MVFNGPFAHKEGPNYQWVAYTGKIPYPRPGTCPGGTFTPSMKSTKDYPDEVINFMRNHPAMHNAVYPVHKRPLVVRTNVDYEFTTISVDQVTAADGNYEVLFLGTEDLYLDGRRGSAAGGENRITEGGRRVRVSISITLICPAALRVIICSAACQQLYVSSAVGLTQLALHRCDVYGEACADCCLARDPYCAWDGKSCSRYSASQKRRSRRQDVKYGNPIRQCRGFNSNGLLLRSLQPSDSGMYQCTATEKNFKHTLVKLQLVVLSGRAVNTALVDGSSGLVPSSLHSSSTQWTPSAGQYKDLLTILSQPEMSLINQYCQDYWQFGDPLLGALKAKDLKELKEQKKPRNRRHHREQEEEEEEEEQQQQGVET